MPFQVHEQANPADHNNVGYGFFTTEKGSSDGSYVVLGENTRNVNLYSPSQVDDEGQPKAGYDSAEKVADNIDACFKELLAGREGTAHKFMMTTEYGKPELAIEVCKSLDDLEKLKAQSNEHLSSGKLNNIATQLNARNINIIKADAVIIKGIPEQQIAVGGASGDAHPVIIYDDHNEVACYIAATHAYISKGIIEKALEKMRELGANSEHLRLIIGPGLGPRSYEFGDNAAEYLGVPKDKVTYVKNNQGESKALINMGEAIRFKAMGLMKREHVYNTELDTMGFDLYDRPSDAASDAPLKRKTEVNFAELAASGPLFFGARRKGMQINGMDAASNPGIHSTVGRHGAGFVMGRKSS